MNQPSVPHAMPETIGRYRLDAVLGQGGMGVVYRAYDTHIDRVVALKTIHRELLRGEDREQWLMRFNREVKAAGRCNHRHIVIIYDYGEVDGYPFIAMEYVESRSLSEFLKKRTMSLKAARSIMLQLLSALDHAHEQGIVHRDIKAANILLVKNGTIKVTDFGIARLAGAALTATPRTIGTPSYMAPEQLSGDELTAQTDLYAAGIVFYEMLCGDKPFTGQNISELMLNIVRKPPRPITEINPAIPPGLEAVFSRALAKSPQERYPNGRAFAAGIKQALSDEEITLTAQQTHVQARTALNHSDQGSSWDTATLLKAERRLARFIGAEAKFRVREAMREAKGIEDLYYILSLAIPAEAQRLAFIELSQQENTEDSLTLQRAAYPNYGAMGEETVPRSATFRATERQPPSFPAAEAGFSPSGGEAPRFDEQTLAEIAQALTFYLGPIAKVLVKKSAPEASSKRELCEKLATHLTDREERQQFLRRISS